jgi:hypothetical protein
MTVVTRSFTPEQHETVRRSVEQLFREVASRFPNATLRIDLPGASDRQVLLELSCSLPGTTHIRALPDAGGIGLHLGEATWLDPRPSRRSLGKPPGIVREVVEAVVAGRFEEHLIDTDGSVIGAKSIIHRYGRNRVVSRYRRLSSGVRSRGQERNVRYAPYG